MGEDEAPIDRVFHQLHRPACAETLKLNVVRISATTTDLSDIVEPVEPANNTIQVLELCYTHFSNRRSVRLLWNLVGLKKLSVHNPRFASLADDAPDEDEDDAEEDPDCWAELIRRQKTILSEHVILEMHVDGTIMPMGSSMALLGIRRSGPCILNWTVIGRVRRKVW